MKSPKSFFNPWLFKMAWRDSRTHRKRLLLFMTSIVLGIAALVSIGSFGKNLEKAIDEQAKNLLGADMMLSGLQPFGLETEALFDSIGGKQARETLFGSMAYFPKTGGTRLVQVRAIAGDFPFYGKIGTLPEKAVQTYKTGPFALVDDALLVQYEAAVGDSVRVGAVTFRIAGRLIKLPSEPPIASAFNPRIYIPSHYLAQTNLLQRGSLVNYRLYFEFDDGRNVEELVAAIKPHLNQYRLNYTTVEGRKEQFAETLANLYHFLNLVGFIALILGSIGVASAVHVYIKQKLTNVAILRCLGSGSGDTFLIYIIQVGAMAGFGALLGALLGMLIQLFLPKIFSDFIPVQIEPFIAWASLIQGVLIGLGLTLLFALLPLISIRKVSPLLSLRADYENASGKRDKLRWLIYLLIGIGVLAFAISQTEEPAIGIWFAVAVFVAFGVLSGVAKLITFSFRKFFPTSWTYVWRQGLANLYRPNNQTLVLMLSIGLGTFLITTLYLSHNILLDKVSFVGGGNRPNLVFFDVQPDQKDELAEVIKSHNIPILQEAPMVTMRISSLKGESVTAILSDTTRDVNRGLLRWEFRTTYRDSLLDSEKIVDGKWIGRVDAEAEVIPISFEQGSARRLRVALGDTLVWDVQGVPLTTRIASLRSVDWQRVQANFMVLFPTNVLEIAPQIYVLAAKAPATEQSAALQRQVVETFPNISTIDLGLVLKTVDGFLDKISFVIRFMAVFSILTGLIVLVAAIVTSRFQRVQESVLLRTLGASRKQIMRIMIIEYLFLGGFAALTGLLLSYAANSALAYFVFDSVFIPTALPFLLVLIIVIGLTITIGMLNSRGILDRPPLEVLRMEV